MYFILAFILMLLAAAPAFAFGWGDVTGFFGDQILGAVAMIVATVSTFYLKKLHNLNANGVKKVSDTLVQGGQFMEAVGAAIADPVITNEEVGKIVKEGKDVFDVYKPTPAKYSHPNIPEAPEKH